MNSPDALYFPTTALWSLRQYPFLLLLPKIHILSPVEDDEQGLQKEKNSFIISGLCQEHTPCPLGADRSRFLKLVADIKARTDDYAAQLSALTLAGYTAPPSSGENSEHEIINAMFIPADLTAREKDVKEQQELWRARLILAVGDQLDQEHEEIAFHMQAVENDEHDLFQELQGEDNDRDDDEELYSILSNLTGELPRPNPNQVKNRFNAWKTLLSKTTALPNDIVLLTDRDNGDILLESYEKMAATSPLDWGAVELPSLLGPDDDAAMEKVSDFREKNREICNAFQKELTELQTLQATALELLKSNREQLQNITNQLTKELDSAFPAQKYGRRTLSIYLCPQSTARNLLLGEPPLHADNQTNTVLFIAE